MSEIKVVGNTRVAVGAIGVSDTRWSRASDIDACDIALSSLASCNLPVSIFCTSHGRGCYGHVYVCECVRSQDQCQRQGVVSLFSRTLAANSPTNTLVEVVSRATRKLCPIRLCYVNLNCAIEAQI
jgi:hypothetical protein